MGLSANENRLIAEFLGAKQFKYRNVDEYEMFGIIESIEDGENEKHFYLPEQMSFDTDYNWIMDVVEKIESLDFDFNIYTPTIIEIWKDGEHIIYIDGEGSKIEAVCQGVVEFIKWYNSQQK